jgi:hypothetical protein
MTVTQWQEFWTDARSYAQQYFIPNFIPERARCGGTLSGRKCCKSTIFLSDIEVLGGPQVINKMFELTTVNDMFILLF